MVLNRKQSLAADRVCYLNHLQRRQGELLNLLALADAESRKDGYRGGLDASKAREQWCKLWRSELGRVEDEIRRVNGQPMSERPNAAPLS